jgi:hypothetical protein
LKRLNLLLVLAVPVLSLQLVGCGQPRQATAAEAKPATVEHLAGAEPSRVTLTDEAAKRIDLQTATVAIETIGGSPREVIPYSAIVYDTGGKTWAYISPSPLTYVRHAIAVDHIEGDKAILSENLPANVSVVTVGTEELFGSESEFEEE